MKEVGLCFKEYISNDTLKSLNSSITPLYKLLISLIIAKTAIIDSPIKNELVIKATVRNTFTAIFGFLPETQIKFTINKVKEKSLVLINDAPL